jgi:hypothetical protein
LRLALLEHDLEVLTGNRERLLAVAIVAREHAGEGGFERGVWP